MCSFSKGFATGPSCPVLAPRWNIPSVHPCSGLESTRASSGAHPSFIYTQTLEPEGQPHSVLRPTANIQSWIQIRFSSGVFFFRIFDKYSSVHALLPAAVPEIVNWTQYSKSNMLRVSSTEVSASLHILLLCQSSHLQHPNTHHQQQAPGTNIYVHSLLHYQAARLDKNIANTRIFITVDAPHWN